MSPHSEIEDLPASEESEESGELCVSCLFPNEPGSTFCAKCGAPLSSYASTGPFEHIFAEGFAYRKAVEKPGSLIVVLGIWLLFGPAAVLGITLLVFGAIEGPKDLLMTVLFLVPSVVMIWRTTRSYLRFRRTNEVSDSQGTPSTPST